MSGSEEGEVFLSLEDDFPAESPARTVGSTDGKAVNAEDPAPSNEPTSEDTPVIEADLVDTSVLTDATGSYTVSWPILGMDCPDCASKATRAMNQMKQVSNPNVSVTSGEVRFDIDLELGPLFEISSVLRSLGHAPDVEHHELVGVKASAVAQRNGVPVQRLDRVIRRQPGVLDVEISDDDRILLQLVVTSDKALLDSRRQGLEAVLGRPPEFSKATSNRVRPDQWRLIGGGIALPVLIIVMAAELLGYHGPLIPVLAAPGVAIGGIQMFKEAYGSLRSFQMGFQVLTSLAVIGACILGMWEEALIVTILVAFTVHLEGDALLKAREAMQGGLDRLPRTARKVNKSPAFSLKNVASIGAAPTTFALPMATGPTLAPGHDEEENVVPIDLIHPGDHIEIRSGELIPADGRIVEGTGALNKAPLTGESVPVDVGVGDVIEAGLVLAQGPVVCEVLAVGDNTRLSGLIDAVHTFREVPPRLHSGIEKFTAIWVPLVLFGAFAVWYFAFPDDWKIILLLWVVSCPCALLLATPVPHAAALSNAAQSGAVVRGGDALERMANVNHILLDKTGTLTSGKPKIGTIVLGKGRRMKSALQVMMGLEARSNHPYALSILEHGQTEGIEAASIKGLTDIDAGVAGKHGTADVAFIRPDKAEAMGVAVEERLLEAFEAAKAVGHGASLLVKDKTGIALATFVHDDTRDGSMELISAMRERNINVEILSGDHQQAVSEFARSVGLPESSAHGGLSPEEKVQWVQARSSSHVTMMVGDGFNDAAALAVADVGVAIGTGESVNLEAADVLIPGDDPRLLTDMIDLARQAQRTLMQNLFFSVFITVTLVFAVIQQWYDQLWVGVLIHELSVIIVILNGARLAQNGQSFELLKQTLSTMVDDTKLAFSTLRARYFPAKS
ncbi:MAG: heavy metal translocating P-type ATPase [Poseidonia sp.]